MHPSTFQESTATSQLNVFETLSEHITFPMAPLPRGMPSPAPSGLLSEVEPQGGDLLLDPRPGLIQPMDGPRFGAISSGQKSCWQGEIYQ